VVPETKRSVEPSQFVALPPTAFVKTPPTERVVDDACRKEDALVSEKLFVVVAFEEIVHPPNALPNDTL
jgi:hypothetical protein